MTEHRLKIPISEETIRKLKLGDMVYLTGRAYTQTYAIAEIVDAVKKGEKLPWLKNLKNSVFPHGTASFTSSARYNWITPEFIKLTGVRAIMGKGGMSQAVLDAMETYGCVYLAGGGGINFFFEKGVEKTVNLGWPNVIKAFRRINVLELHLKDFGPFPVTMDANGNSMYDEFEKRVEEKLPAITKKLGASDIELPYFVM
jgi:fumarate hydratase subunit beta